MTQSTKKNVIHRSIPYLYCFEEAGMIETEPGVYTRTYRIQPPDGTIRGNYNEKMTRRQMETLLKKLSMQFSFEFTVRNCRIDRKEYLSRVMLDEESDMDGYGKRRTKKRGIFTLFKLSAKDYNNLEEKKRVLNPLGIYITDYNIVDVE